MSTNIIYKNAFGDTVTNQQKNRLDQYTEETFVSSRLKKKRKYYDNKIEYEYHYVYSDEILAAELATLTDPDITYIVAKDHLVSGDYTTWKFYDYDGTTLDTEYMMHVYDAQGRDIAYAEYNASNVLIWSGTKKYYLSGKILNDDDGDLELEYQDDHFVIFDFSSGSLVIEVHLDVVKRYTSMTSFTDYWGDMFPFMSASIVTYFSTMEPLIPSMTL